MDELYAKAPEGGCGRTALRTAGSGEEFAELLDLPAVFPHIWGHLGWNIVVDHSQVDVDAAVAARPARLRAGQEA